jgi:hypothetical protein
MAQASGQPAPPALARARAEYIQGDVSLRGLAERHAVSLRVLAQASKDEGWVRQREEFRNKTATVAAERAVEWQADYLARGRKLAAANALLVMKELHAAAQGQGRLSARELDALSRATGSCFKALCDALGLPVVETGSAEVELPDDPLAELSAGLAARPEQPLELVRGKG